MAPGPDFNHCLLKQYEELISGLKIDLTKVMHSTLMINDDNSDLADKRSTISKAVFITHLQIQRLLQTPAPAPLEDVIELPKIDVSHLQWD